jgi:hypothetical protein
MYQDVLDKLYIASKCVNLSISGPKIVNMFEYDDKNKAGKVTQATFIERLFRFADHNQKRSRHSFVIRESDIRFLSTKYIDR